MIFRKATHADVQLIVAMIADDELGKIREDFKIPLPESYYNAFENINSDENQELIFVENDKLQIVGFMQLSFLQYLITKEAFVHKLKEYACIETNKDLVLGKPYFIGPSKE